MARLFRKILLALGLGIVAGTCVVLVRSSDPVYVIEEWVHRGAYRRYDAQIREVAHRTGVDPSLIKALIWRESGFKPDKVGKDGEVGLMQILPTTARDWAKAAQVEGFSREKLFDPATNMEAGTWYLKMALDHWKDRDDPIPFALAEYNAGRGRAHRWVEQTHLGPSAKAGDFYAAISFPTTRDYVEAITARRDFYRKRNEF